MSVATPPAVERVYLSAPDVTEVEEQALVRALRSGWVAPAGPDLAAFETELAERVGVSSAVALSSGTAALHLGLLALGVRPGDVVVTTTLTFAATANAITYVGATPHFVDVMPETGNLDPELLERALTELASAGARVGAIIPVDLLGKAANYTEIEPIAARFGVPVLADAAESLGARHAGRAVGSFGDASILSFNGNKIMTTSGGGMLLSNDADLVERVRYLSTQARQPVVHYEHTDIGFNYRLSNLLAALGRAQLGRLDEMIARRRAVRDGYRTLFADVAGVSVLGDAGDADDNCWLTAILVDEKAAGWSTEALRDALEQRNIESRPVWKPMHLQAVFADSRSTITGAAEQLFRRGLTLPSGSAMTAEEFDRVQDAIRDFLSTRELSP